MKVAVIGSRGMSVPDLKKTFGGYYGDLFGRGARHRYVNERIYTGFLGWSVAWREVSTR